jgi:hypothetical protein
MMFLGISIYSMTLAQGFGDPVLLTYDPMNPSYPIENSIQVIDMDNDGDQDVLVATYTEAGDQLIWYQNVGSPYLRRKGALESHYESPDDIVMLFKIKAAGLNQEGNTEFIAAEQWPWYIGSGALFRYELDSGGMDRVHISQYFDTYISFMALEDIDNDGDTDLLIRDSEGLKHHLRDSLGHFGLGTMILDFSLFENYPSFMEQSGVGDIDSDGDVDILLTNWSGLSWLENLGDTSFAPPQPIGAESLNDSETYLDDIDLDGDIDILFLETENGNLGYMVNQGDGQFDRLDILTEMGQCSRLSYEDINVDGLEDIILLSDSEGSLLKLNGLGGGSFTEPENINLDQGLPFDYLFFDPDNDNDPDILSMNTSGPLVWYENGGDGEFGDHYFINSSSGGIKSLLIVDLENDSSAEIVVASQHEDKIVALRNDGPGHYKTQTIPNSSVEGIDEIVSGDIDGDGDQDILATSSSGYVYWLRNEGFDQLLIHDTISHVESSRHVFLEDYNGDGFLDAIFDVPSQNRISIFLNSGDAQFVDSLSLDLGATAYELKIVDVDGDSDKDVLCSLEGLYQIMWLENVDGGGTTVQHDLESILASARALSFGDMDGDGVADIAAAGSGQIIWSKGEDGGVYGDWAVIESVEGVVKILKIVDLNNDDLNDLVFLDALGGFLEKISWKKGLGMGEFGPSQDVLEDWVSVRDIAFHDLDSDGDSEILISNGGRVMAFENLLGEGCTDSTACNYESTAIIDDGSCCYWNCGCTDVNATNYDSTTTCDDGSCVYDTGGASSDYIPFLGQDKEWWVSQFNFESCSCGNEDAAVLKYDTDTLLDGQNVQRYAAYQVSGIYCEPICFEGPFAMESDVEAQSNFSAMYLSEDTISKKVYIHFGTERKLLYDFGAEIGDTLITSDFLGSENLQIVDNVDSIDIGDGTYRKRLILNQWENEWIEGIGNYPQGPFITLDGFGVGHVLECFRKNGQALFGTGCGLITGLRGPSFVQGEFASPNPFTTELLIDLSLFNDEVDLLLFDSQGRECRHVRIPKGLSRYVLDRESLKAGVYFLRLFGSDLSHDQRLIIQ